MLVQVNEKPFEDLKHCMASLTKGVVKFAQVPQAQRRLLAPGNADSWIGLHTSWGDGHLRHPDFPRTLEKS